MGTFTAKDFVDFVNDEFDVETLQLMQNVLNDRLTLLNKMKDMANPRTVVQGYKLNKQDLKEMRGFTMQELRMKAIEILQMIGVTQNEKNIQDIVDGIIAKIKKYNAGAVFTEGKVSRERLEAIVREEVNTFLTPVTEDEQIDERFFEIVQEGIGSDVQGIVYEIAEAYGYRGERKRKSTVTGLVREMLDQIPSEERKGFLIEVTKVQQLYGVDEIIL